MAEYIAKRNNRCPTHPGEIIRDIVRDLDMSVVAVAKAIGISRQHFYKVMNTERPVSPDMAVRFSKAFGSNTLFWLRMQSAYDAWHADRDIDVSNILSLKHSVRR